MQCGPNPELNLTQNPLQIFIYSPSSRVYVELQLGGVLKGGSEGTGNAVWNIKRDARGQIKIENCALPGNFIGFNQYGQPSGSCSASFESDLTVNPTGGQNTFLIGRANPSTQFLGVSQTNDLMTVDPPNANLYGVFKIISANPSYCYGMEYSMQGSQMPQYGSYPQPGYGGQPTPMPMPAPSSMNMSVSMQPMPMPMPMPMQPMPAPGYPCGGRGGRMHQHGGCGGYPQAQGYPCYGIVYAKYGDLCKGGQTACVDVTSTVSSMVSGSTLNIGPNYNSVFGDPAVGVRKGLLLVAYNKSNGSFKWGILTENAVSQVDLAARTPLEDVRFTSYNDTQIMAVYGDLNNRSYIDVSSQVMGYCTSRQSVSSYNAVFSDPKPGIVKGLFCIYSVTGVHGVHLSPENGATNFTFGYTQFDQPLNLY